jgi:hypothetical protein
MNYTCRHFRIEELVPKDVFEKFGDRSWQFLNPVALKALDNIREHFDDYVTVNNWLWGGPFQARGFRPMWSNVGASLSQHRLGNAFDLDVDNLSAKAVRAEIILHKHHPHFRDINCLEADVNWVHFDCRNIPEETRILIVHP